MRAKNEKALTIKSQMRYVKYFYGFLCLKLAEGKPLEKHQSFFELALKKHNYTEVSVKPVTYKSFESTKKQEEEEFEIKDIAAKLDGLQVEDVAKWQKHHTKLKKN